MKKCEKQCNTSILNNNKYNKEEGITMIALVITIIVLLILATVMLVSFNDSDAINATRNNVQTYSTNKEGMSNDVEDLITKLDAKSTEDLPLTKAQINAVNSKITTATSLEQLEVPYEAKEITDDETSQVGKGRSVTVEGAYSGTGTDQVFNQLDIGAIGANKLKWYVLSADENGVNLVSEPTRSPVQFKDSPGYDNYLYYLNELSTKLFANEDYGVTESRVHAFRLTDIKYAAEQANADYKVTDNGTERDWSWDIDFIKGAPYDSSGTKVYNDGNLGKKTVTPSNKYYPGIYTADTNNEVVANNPLYDETPGNKITTDSDIKRTLADNSNPASKLTVNYTYIGYINARDTTITNLGNFGSSQIAGELFKANGTTYHLASRCVSAYSSGANFDVRRVRSGYLYSTYLCNSLGQVGTVNEALRVVVSVPSNKINIAENGTVTLKQTNS